MRPFDTVMPTSGNQTHFQDVNPSQNKSDPFNTNTKSTLEWWKKKWENFEIFDLKEHIPKTLMSFRKATFSSSFLIFSLNPKIFSGQSVLEVFQGKQNLACLSANYCKVCRFLLFSVTTNNNEETPITVIIWKKEAPRLD